VRGVAEGKGKRWSVRSHEGEVDVRVMCGRVGEGGRAGGEERQFLFYMRCSGEGRLARGRIAEEGRFTYQFSFSTSYILGVEIVRDMSKQIPKLLQQNLLDREQQSLPSFLDNIQNYSSKFHTPIPIAPKEYILGSR
jgi:hypothetical protein